MLVKAQLIPELPWMVLLGLEVRPALLDQEIGPEVGFTVSQLPTCPGLAPCPQGQLDAQTSKPPVLRGISHPQKLSD